MLDFEAFVFLRAHNWDGKNQEMKWWEATTRSVHESFEVLQKLKKTLWKNLAVAQPESNLLP